MDTQKPTWDKIITPTWYVYGAMLCAFLLAVTYTLTDSSSAKAKLTTTDEPSTTSLDWVDSPPHTLTTLWETPGVIDLAQTPGAAIAATEHDVFRVNPDTGERLWEYYRPDATVCDIEQAWGDAVVVYNSGGGCTDITRLSGETGEYVSQASYATDQTDARLVYGNDSQMLALVTPTMVRLLRSDLVTTSEFGEKVDPEDPENVKKCTIYDVSVGSKAFSVANQCSTNTSGTTHVTVVENDPEDSTSPETVLDIDTKSPHPVTTPVTTLAQVQFVTQGNNPISFTWQIDKDKEEVRAIPVRQGEYGLGGTSFDGLGYVWLTGTRLYQRYGSEDVSQFTHTISGASGLPVEVDGRLLVPTFKGVSLWDTETGDLQPITLDTPTSIKKIAVAGKTVVALSDGNLIGVAK